MQKVSTASVAPSMLSHMMVTLVESALKDISVRMVSRPTVLVGTTSPTLAMLIVKTAHLATIVMILKVPLSLLLALTNTTAH